MSTHDDNEEPDLECPHCSRSFHSYVMLESHMNEHEGPRHCQNCGKQLQANEYHRC